MEEVPVEGEVEVYQLTELVLLGGELVLSGCVPEFQGVAHEEMVVEIGERDSCELHGSELDVDVLLLLADARDVAEVAEEVVDVSDLQVPDALEEENSAAGCCRLLQLDLMGGAPQLLG
jgi:hypothetical protein